MGRVIEERVARCLTESGLTVGTAESCTAGAVGTALTRTPGSSAYFLGGILAYHNDVKIRLLGVPEAVLAAHGAVSAPVARAMARGALDALGADLALATTGILGPDGGTEEKPVGLVYIALASRTGDSLCERRVWTGGRRWENSESTVRAALEILEGYLTDGRGEDAGEMDSRL